MPNIRPRTETPGVDAARRVIGGVVEHRAAGTSVRSTWNASASVVKQGGDVWSATLSDAICEYTISYEDRA